MMIDPCENCHIEPAYTPKVKELEGYPKLCFNCYIKAEGLMLYSYRMIENGAEVIESLEQLWKGIETLRGSSTIASLSRILNTLGEYWERIGDTKPQPAMTAKGRPLRRIK